MQQQILNWGEKEGKKRYIHTVEQLLKGTRTGASVHGAHWTALEFHVHGAASVTLQQALFLWTFLCVWSEIRWNWGMQLTFILFN